jgi:hypothetical protein
MYEVSGRILGKAEVPFVTSGRMFEVSGRIVAGGVRGKVTQPAETARPGHELPITAIAISAMTIQRPRVRLSAHC